MISKPLLFCLFLRCFIKGFKEKLKKKMRNFLFFIGLFLCSVYSSLGQQYIEMIDDGSYLVSEIVTSGEAYFSDKDKGRGSGYKQFKRWEYMAQRLINAEGYLTSQADKVTELERYNKYLNQTADSRKQLLDNWTEMGPTYWNATTHWSPGVGRVTGFAVDPTNTDHIIVGAENGGVWRSINDGDTWSPLCDYFSNMDVYCVTIDPSNTDTYFFGSSSGRIYKSGDTGATWNELADLGNSKINKILINPNNTDIIFASCENVGFFSSFDGGVTWSSPIANDNRSYDIEFKPADTNVVYATGESFHKSTDGGLTFETISSVFDDGPKMMGVTTDDSNVVFLLESEGGSFNALYKSIDEGETFTELDHTGRNYFGYDTNGIEQGGQAPRDMDICVNPQDADEVHIAGILTWRSLDGGATFENTSDWIPEAAANQAIGYHHADVDMLEFVGSSLYVGSDGGIFRAADTSELTSDYYQDLTTGLGIRQFYKIGVSQTPDLIITGGSQDNGSSFYTDTSGWIDFIGADGMEGFVSNYNSNIIFGMIQFGGMYRTTNQGGNLQSINWPEGGSANWVTPMEEDPQDQNTIYAAGKSVYKSTNNGGSWNSISQQRPTNIDNLKIAPSNNQIMYFSENNRIFRTQDGGATAWLQTTNPGGTPRSIAIHPTNPNKIAVATSHTNKVFVSNDGGLSWEGYLKNLPNFSATAIIWDDNGQDGLYLGMNYGVYYIDNSLELWQPYNANLPNVIVNEFDINNVTNTLFVATFGRGLWSSALVDDVLDSSNFMTNEDIIVYPNPASEFITIAVPQSIQASLRLFDLSGKLLQYHKDVVLDGAFTLSIEEASSGVYFLRIITSKGTITKKVIKK